MTTLFILSGLVLLVTVIAMSRDRKYEEKNYKDVAPDEIKKLLNLKTADAHFDEHLAEPHAPQSKLSRQILSEMNREEDDARDKI